MQDNWQDFDRQIKSVMQDAEEKVPRRVWRAVSARLDSAAAAAAWWKWAVPAFAAAALVAGLFFAVHRDGGSVNPDDIQVLAQSVQEPSAAEPVQLAEADIPELIAEVTPKVTHKVVHASVPVSKELVPAGEKADQPALQAEETVKQPAAEHKTGGHEENQDNAEQWARIIQEDNMSRSSGINVRGFYASGGVGGNDSNISYGGNGISRMAPGAGSPDAGISEAGSSTYGVPFTLGLGVRFRVADKLSLGTGVEYSLLTRSFNGTYVGSAASPYEGSIFHNVHYIGIPLNIYYDLLSTRDGLMNVYAWGGGAADYCIANNYRLMSATPSVINDKAGGFQFSAALGLGLEFKLSDKLGLYLDPAVRYYFPSPGQPKSVRTDKPFMFNFDAGLRFNI
ncbi:MAG: PorT family protein [Bacteroidales bacterium]|nr:PorT family protein [Bacteroidales bacterium]